MSKYVIVDLEMCNVPKKKKCEKFHWRNELIEIGAVLLDDDFEIVDEFKSYVAPQYGEVDAFIQRLTGITPKDTASAPSTKEALEAFVEWLPEDAVLVSWSENDELQIRREIMAKDIDIPGMGTYLDNWEDCQKTFSEKMNSSKTYRLSEALIITNIDYEEGAHDALVDAYNTGLLFAKMKREVKLVLNPYYVMADDDDPYSDNACSGLLSRCRYAV